MATKDEYDHLPASVTDRLDTGNDNQSWSSVPNVTSTVSGQVTEVIQSSSDAHASG